MFKVIDVPAQPGLEYYLNSLSRLGVDSGGWQVFQVIVLPNRVNAFGSSSSKFQLVLKEKPYEANSENE